MIYRFSASAGERSNQGQRRKAFRGGATHADGTCLPAAHPAEELERRLLLTAAPPTFAPVVSIHTGGVPSAIVAFSTANTNPDFAVADSKNNSVDVLLGDGKGNFGSQVSYPTGTDPTALANFYGDLDAGPDLITADSGSGDVSVLAGQTDISGNNLTFSPPIDTHVVPANSGPLALAVGLETAYGSYEPSVAVASTAGLFLLPGISSTTEEELGVFQAPVKIADGSFSGVTFFEGEYIAATDPVNGTVDIFVPQNGAYVPDGSYFVGKGVSAIAVGDFNDDNIDDLAVTVPNQDAVYVLLENTTTTSPTPTTAPTPTPTPTPLPTPTPVPTPAAPNNTADQPEQFPTGTFAAPFAIQLDQTPVTLTVNMFGVQNDIITADPSGHSVTIISGNGDGTFSPPADYSVGTQPVGLFVSDDNGDSFDDLAVADASGSVNVLFQDQAQLNLTLTASPNPVMLGQSLSYLATISNTGDGPAANVTLADTLPPGATLVSATPSQGTVDTSTPGTVNASLGDLPAGASATLTLVVQPTVHGLATDRIQAHTDSQVPLYPMFQATASAAVTGTSGAEVAITETGDATVFAVPATANYVLTVTNYGPDSAQGLTLAETLPADSTIVSATSSQGTVGSAIPGQFTVSLGDLAAGASATVDFSANLAAAGAATNSATVTAADPSTDPAPGDNTVTYTTTVIPIPPPPSHPTPPPTTPTPTPTTPTPTPAPPPSLSVNNVTQTDVTSGKTQFVFAVMRTGNLNGKSSFHYATVNGTAKAGAAFVYSSGFLSFAAGASKVTVTVPVLGTKVYEPNENFFVMLSQPKNAVFAGAKGTGTIVSGVRKPTPTPTPTNIDINFEPPGGPAVAGYYADTGSSFGPRSGGLSFGWSSDNSANAVDRNALKDARYDTFNVLGSPGAASWSIAVPDGRYAVHLYAGDAKGVAGDYKIEVNGSLVLNGKTSAANPFASGSGVITVSDGRLVLTPGKGSGEDKLDFLVIKRVG
jgi:uncharacterized repeat protein (TIGR01451 family)